MHLIAKLYYADGSLQEMPFRHFTYENPLGYISPNDGVRVDYSFKEVFEAMNECLKTGGRFEVAYNVE